MTQRANVKILYAKLINFINYQTIYTTYHYLWIQIHSKHLALIQNRLPWKYSPKTVIILALPLPVNAINEGREYVKS